MIRTRDIFIFVIVLFVLGVGIAWTVSRDVFTPGSTERLSDTVAFDTASTTFEATRDDTNRDRQGFIEHLRDMLALGGIDIVPEPSVEEDGIDDEATSTEQIATDGSSALISCGGDDAALAARGWPLSGVSLEVVGGVRRAVVANTSVPTSSTTQTMTTPKILIQMPVSPSKLSTAGCVGSPIIGVTVTGSLMYNNEASFYRGFGAEYLIGYARDGFPIYGYYEGQTDPCGGYDHPSGYRYTVRATSDHLLSCYTGQPAPFSAM